MKNLRKLLTAALAATMLVGAVSVSTPAAAWHRWGWGGPGWGAYYGYGGWRRPGYWGYGAGVATGLALGAATTYPYGYGYWGSANPGYYGYSGYSGCGCGW